MVVHIHIIENYDTQTFEDAVNEYLKKWTGRIVNYSIAKNLVQVKHSWGRTVNVFRHDALFIVNPEIGKEMAPPVDIHEAKRTDAIG